ncbi:MAG: endonuclease [Candidatus Syntrophosphaera sp.]|nr:endonuclease [Candidatus Syntrophosphaera sp.]
MLRKTLACAFAIFAFSLGFGLYVVNFEGPSEIKPAYASGTVNLSGLDWDLTEVLIGTLEADFKNGERSARLRGYGTSAMTMLEDKSGGLGTLSFLYRRYGTDPQVDWKAEYSVDAGNSWIQIGSSFTAPASDVPQTFSQAVNMPGNVRIRVKRATETGTSNNRLNIDDITLTDYVSSAELLVSGDLLPFSTSVGIPSAAQSYSLSGTDLAENIDIAAPHGFEISSDGGLVWQTQASLPPAFNGLIQVRMTGAMSGTYGGYIVHSSLGAENALLPVAGEVSGQAGFAADLFISEYIEGSSYNKALEIFNGTGNTADLSDYRLETYFNGASTPSPPLTLSGYLPHGEVLVLAHSSANQLILDQADIINNSVINFNGDDAIVLRKVSNGDYIDIFGVIGDDPGTAWLGDGGYSTQDRTLVRKPSVSAGITENPTGTGSGAFTTLASEWDLYAQDSFTNLGWHSFEGSGEEVDPPTAQASAIISYPTSSTIALEWTPGNGSRRLVKINTLNSFTDPLDGTSLPANPVWAGAGEQVIFNGSTQIIEDLPFNGCEVTGLGPDTTWWFRIYEYNGSGTFIRYLTVPATGNPASATTLPSQGTDYYSDVYGYGAALKGNLHILLRNTHSTQYSYSALLTQIPYTDEDPDNFNNIIEIYTGWSVDKDDFGNEGTDWNREHVWSKSHGDFGDVAPAGTDLHHLRPCDSTVNFSKSNKDFGNGGSPYVDSSPPAGYSGVTGCYSTSYSWEPRYEDKGDVARMMMYMAVRYEGTDTSYDLELVDHFYSEGGAYLPHYGKLATLLQWHVQDPPDPREARRNDRIYERQGNRNPFIDVPAYAQYIWAPVPLANSSVTTSGFTGHWSTPISATAYYLQLATDSLFTSLVGGYVNLNVNLSTSRSFTGLNAGTTYYYRLRSWFEDDYGMYSPFMRVTLLDTVLATATLTPAQTLEETNLQGAALTFSLQNAAFLDAELSISSFVLNDAPAGLSIQSVSHLNPTTATIILAFDGTDFDDNYHSFRITVAASEISVDYPVTSFPLGIIAHVEGTATIALEGEFIRLTLTPLSGAVAYHVFAADEPWGGYIEVSAEGLFDPAQINVWRIVAAFAERRFFRVSAVRD